MFRLMGILKPLRGQFAIEIKKMLKNIKNQKYRILRQWLQPTVFMRTALLTACQGERLKKGFSFIEVLLSLMILSVGISSVSFMMVGNIRNAQNSKNQIIASALAQEGIELIRNLKDNKKPILDAMNTVGTYPDFRIDINMADIDNVTSNSKLLYLDNATGFYTHSGGNATKFHRFLTIAISGDKNAVPSTRQTMVTSYVIWGGAVLPANCTVLNKCVSVVSVIPDLIN